MEKEVASDYSKFMNVDYTNRFDSITKHTNEMLARVDEFQFILRMAQSKTSTDLTNSVEDVLLLKDKVSEVCKRVDNLDKFVSDVEENLDGLESYLTSAETNLGGTGPLKTFLKPLSLFGNAPKPSDPLPTIPSTFIPINTSEYFPQKMEQEEEAEAVLEEPLKLKSFTTLTDNLDDSESSEKVMKPLFSLGIPTTPGDLLPSTSHIIQRPYIPIYNSFPENTENM